MQGEHEPERINDPASEDHAKLLLQINIAYLSLVLNHRSVIKLIYPPSYFPLFRPIFIPMCVSLSQCSKTCGTGWERRHVLCRDERGESDKCDRKLKPDQFRSCSSGPCPSWTAENWSNVSFRSKALIC